jgi:spermidine synthase
LSYSKPEVTLTGMPQTALTPETQPISTQFAPRTVMLAVALASFASLLLELAMTRLFSVVLFYHFAFFAISVALLGLGSGGVFAHIRRDWLTGFDLGSLGTLICILSSLSIPIVVWIVLHTPVSLQVSGENFARLTVIYVATAVPFFFTGLLFSVLFARSTGAISILYGADLAGGATACLAVVPLLNTIGAPDSLILCSVVMALAGALWAGSRKIGRSARVLVVIALAFLIWSHHGRRMDVIYAKGMLRDPKWVEFAQWNAISRIEVNNQNGSRYVVIDADATTAIVNVDPAKWGQDQRSSPAPTHTGIPGQGSFNWKKNLMAAAPSLANVLRPQGDFAIIGPGGGVDVLRAVANGSGSVTGIEINPIIVNDVMRERYSDYSYHLYDLPQVHIHVQDGRSYVRSSREKYDVVQMTLVDTWASTAAGAFALSENNLYTVEAFREYFDHLKPDGMIAITRWEFHQPREALRVVSQAIEALHRLGVPDPRNNFIIVADGSLNEDGRPVLVLAKKSPFTQSEYALVAAHERANPNLVWLNPASDFTCYSPGAVKAIQWSSADGTGPCVRDLPPAAEAFRNLIESNNPRAFARDYAYNVAPVYDGAPFFFFTMKTGYVLKNIAAGTGKGMDWRINLGVVVLGMLLIISMLAVLAFLVLPLALYGRDAGSRKTALPALLYFIAIGFGYILVEISLIQRFVLFLGHPTYALTVVVFLLLLSSGAGSIAARRWIYGSRRQLILTLIAVAITIDLILVPWLLSATVGLAFVLKLLISGAILIPLGFAMGMPFPTGLRLVNAVEWAWALNASASVLGSVMAMVIAIHFGLTVTMACAAIAYLLAAVCSLTWKPS